MGLSNATGLFHHFSSSGGQTESNNIQSLISSTRHLDNVIKRSRYGGKHYDKLSLCDRNHRGDGGLTRLS